MKHEYDSDKLISSNKKLLSWEELLEKGALLKERHPSSLPDARHALSCYTELHRRYLSEGRCDFSGARK